MGRGGALRAWLPGRVRGILLGGCLAVSVGASPAAAAPMREAGAVPEARWRPIESLGVRGERPLALARSEDGALLAVGDEAGVTWWRAGRRERAALPGVLDLVFDAENTLWIATSTGLLRWSPGDRPRRRALPGGERVGWIHRVVASGSSLLLATEAGAYWSSEGSVFQALPLPGRASRATRVAIRPAHFDAPAASLAALSPARRAQAWVFGSGRLTRVRGIVREGGLRVSDVQGVDLPRVSTDRLLADLAVAPDGRRLFLVYEDLLAWRLIDGTDGIDADGGLQSGTSWQLERPVMPPGARIRRLGWAAGRVWLATDHGLLESAGLTEPFRRSPSPLGTSDCADLQPRGEAGALALCRQGVFALTSEDGPLGLGAGSVAGPRREGLPPDPPVAALRRRALERAGLAAARSETLWSGLRRRAFWPDVSLRFGFESDEDRRRDADQSIVSGQRRSVLDRIDDDARRYDASIELDWELGGISYPDDSVDLSRELRQVVSLRDDVADEIHQLYFERQGIRERLAGDPTLEPEERARLRQRASELEAGLDAWTGGWLSRWRFEQSGSGPGGAVRSPGSSVARDLDHDLDFDGSPDHPVDREKQR